MGGISNLKSKLLCLSIDIVGLLGWGRCTSMARYVFAWRTCLGVLAVCFYVAGLIWASIMGFLCCCRGCILGFIRLVLLLYPSAFRYSGTCCTGVVPFLFGFVPWCGLSILSVM
jgi:hypothetical protein